MNITEMKEYLDLCLKGKSSIPQRKKVLDIKLQELEERKKEYFSYLIKTKNDGE